MKLLLPSSWDEYELIDTGDFEKLEKYGNIIVRRPEPQAVWGKKISEDKWNDLSQVAFFRDIKSSSYEREGGSWKVKNNIPKNWLMSYNFKDMKLSFKLALTSFKHLGVFPEQSVNWDFIYNKLLLKKNPSVLNLFAYTGIASLAAKCAGADVTHVDSVKQVVSWANENMINSNLQNIRWVVEDAMSYAKREVKRGKKYQAIILDPPAYGRGPKGEKWILEDNIYELLKLCKMLLDEDGIFLINLYSLGFSSYILKNLVDDIFNINSTDFGEIGLKDKSDRVLPLGVYLRF